MKEKLPILIDAARVGRSIEPLCGWYQKHARKLPWRQTNGSYAIWVSEVMLQQTRVEAVIPYYERFMTALPTIEALAEVDDDVLLKLWEGLGYYSRARNLKKAAQICAVQYGGRLPGSYTELLKLPGFGPYTAGAVASIAWNLPVPAVDGNVMRVISRITALEHDIKDPATVRAVRELLCGVIEASEPGILNQALMELGACVCVPNGAPRCRECPVSAHCAARENGQTELFPVKAPKKQRRIEEKTVIVVCVDDGVLLCKRESKGLLANLYSFLCEDGHLTKETVIDICKQHGITVESVSEMKPAKHIFTHIEWHMIGYLVQGTGKTLPYENDIIAARHQIRTAYSIPRAFASYQKEIGLL